jgi:phosphatidylinositol-3-phosphatase
MQKFDFQRAVSLLLVGGLLLSCGRPEYALLTPPRTPDSTSAAEIPKYDHIVVVMEENRAYANIIGNLTDAPFINKTFVPEAAVMTNFHAEAHPSEPNYFALYAGSTFKVADDNNYSEPDPTTETVLRAGGKSFLGYVESSGTNTGAPDGSTLAVRKHNPWESFAGGATVEKDFSSFPTDFTQLPAVCWVIPNLNDDMHDGTILQGDQWLRRNLASYARWALTNNSLLIITWDEDDTDKLVPNQIPTLIIGQYVKPGRYSEEANHYNLLSTILASQNMKGPRNAAAAAPISDIFSPAAPTPTPTPTAAQRSQIEEERIHSVPPGFKSHFLPSPRVSESIVHPPRLTERNCA